MQFFGSQQRELSIAEVKPHLIAKHASRAGAGAVTLVSAMLENTPQKVLVLFHTANK